MVSKERDDVIIDMYESGVPLRLLADWFNTTHVTIATRLDQWGVPRRNGDKRSGGKDLTGRRYGKLVVLCRVTPRTYPTTWEVLCDCGAVKIYQTNLLLKNRSCGCAKRGPRGKDTV